MAHSYGKVLSEINAKQVTDSQHTLSRLGSTEAENAKRCIACVLSHLRNATPRLHQRDGCKFAFSSTTTRPTKTRSIQKVDHVADEEAIS